jgi:hypothetical protein
MHFIDRNFMRISFRHSDRLWVSRTGVMDVIKESPRADKGLVKHAASPEVTLVAAAHT